MTTCRGLFLLLIVSISACGRQGRDRTSGTSADTIVLGAVLSQSGANSEWGTNTREGIELARAEINAAGGLLGRPVAVRYEDSRAMPAEAVIGASRLIDLYHVPVIFGDVQSANCLALAPVLQKAKVINLNFCVAPELSNIGNMIFRNWTSAGADASAIGKEIETEHPKALLVLYQNDAYGQASKNALRQVLKDVPVVEEVPFARDTREYRSVITRMNGMHYDAVYIACYYSEALTFFRQYIELRGRTVPFFGVSEWEDPTLEAFLAKNMPDQIRYALPLPPRDDTPNRSRFLASYRARFGKAPQGILYDNGFDAMYQVASAIDTMRTLVVDSISVGLRRLGSFEGASGTMRFNLNGDVEKPFGIRVVTAKGAAWK